MKKFLLKMEMNVFKTIITCTVYITNSSALNKKDFEFQSIYNVFFGQKMRSALTLYN